MSVLHLLRHGPKNNSAAVHNDGTTASLDPSRFYEVILSSASYLPGLYSADKIEVLSTPVDRALCTAELFSDVFRLDPNLECKVTGPHIHCQIGSFDENISTGEVINLGPAGRSQLWAAAKKHERDPSRETSCIKATLELGLDHTFDNSGISLREVGCRIASFVVRWWDFCRDGKNNIATFAFGHSGDLEIFYYMMHLPAAKWRPADLVAFCEETSGGLQPLSGYSLSIGSEYLELKSVPDDQRTLIISRDKLLSLSQ